MSYDNWKLATPPEYEFESQEERPMRVYDRTIAYMFRGQLWYARKAKNETPVGAVARAIKRRIGSDVTLWWSDCEDGHDCYRAQWFDKKTETFEETRVVVER